MYVKHYQPAVHDFIFKFKDYPHLMRSWLPAVTTYRDKVFEIENIL